MMRTIWVIRHAEREDNIDETWRETATRWDDPPLSRRGVKMAMEIGKFMASHPVDYVFSSPFSRCVQTTSMVLATFQNDHVVRIEPGFAENLAACADPPGRPTMKELLAIHQAIDQTYTPIFDVLPPEPAHEGRYGCIPRVAQATVALLKKFPTGDMMIVSHGSPIAAIHHALVGYWSYVGLGTISKFVQDGDKFTCEMVNGKEHLSDKTRLRDDNDD